MSDKLMEITVGELQEMLKEVHSLRGQLEQVRHLAASGQNVSGVVYGIAEEGLPESVVLQFAQRFGVKIENSDGVYCRGAQVVQHVFEQLSDDPVTTVLSEDPRAWFARTRLHAPTTEDGGEQDA